MKSFTEVRIESGSKWWKARNDGMKVAKIAAAPMLRTIGMRLPNSAQVKPPIESKTIAIRMSDGTFPVRAKPAMTASTITKTGSGMMPIL